MDHDVTPKWPFNPDDRCIIKGCGKVARWWRRVRVDGLDEQSARCDDHKRS